MFVFINLVFCVAFIGCDPLRTTVLPKVNEQLVETRRILRGNEVGDTRPYMVYLRPAENGNSQVADSNWLCGGVIVHESYILTSAACIEEAQHFYVVSGTHRWVPVPTGEGEKSTADECITNGAKKAIWKCVPKSYVFDGQQFDNIRWMISDIAVVKVEDEFNFKKRIKGCDFVPQKIAYNNRTEDFENAGTLASIAGWGATEKFGDVALRSTSDSRTLLETDVVVLSKRKCKKRWPERYHYIIDQSMICGKDGTDTNAMSAACLEHEVNCKELVYSDEDESPETRRFVVDPEKLEVHDATHKNISRRSNTISGGFCENDHGGPLIVGHGKTSVVAGIISACLTNPLTKKCRGPFLYTSVWKFRNLISCAIDKESESTCRRLLRTAEPHETLFNWSRHPDGPAKPQLRSLDKFKYLRSADTFRKTERPRAALDRNTSYVKPFIISGNKVPSTVAGG